MHHWEAVSFEVPACDEIASEQLTERLDTACDVDQLLVQLVIIKAEDCPTWDRLSNERVMIFVRHTLIAEIGPHSSADRVCVERVERKKGAHVLEPRDTEAREQVVERK